MTPSERLKIRLMTDGILVSPEAREALSGEDGSRPLTLADYASTTGISLELEGGIWVNTPFEDYNPNFVDQPPHRLEYESGEYHVRSGDVEVRAHPVPVPDYHDRRTNSGRPYTDFAITHTDRVRISPIQGCSYVCTFCDLPYDKRYERMEPRSLVDSIRVALEDRALPAQHVLISGGVPRDEDWPWLNGVYRSVVAAFPGLPVDVMMVPVPGRFDVKLLHEIGVDALSLNLELFDQELARTIMPKKAKLGTEVWLRVIEEAVELFGPGRIRSLLMVGIEPAEMTLQGVEALAQRGCEPVLSPFRPDPGTPMKDHAPPDAAFLEDVYERSVEIAGRYGVKLGPRCIPCMHNTLTFPDGSDDYYCMVDRRQPQG